MSAQIKLISAVASLAVLLSACSADNSPNIKAPMTIQITSTAFADGQPIPSQHAYDDKNLSPALQWSGVPPAAKSLALICDDLDAPMGTWVHWVIYDLPPTATGLAEGVPKSSELVNGAKQGVNDFKQTGYGGPSPPPGKPHHYFFKIYALDTVLNLNPGATKADLLKAMDSHVLAQGQLMGTYQRK